MSETYLVTSLAIGPNILVKKRKQTAKDVHEAIQAALSTIPWYDERYTVISILVKYFYDGMGLQFALEKLSEKYKEGFVANCRDLEDHALVQFVIVK